MTHSSFCGPVEYIGSSTPGVAMKMGFPPPVPSKELVPQEDQTTSILIPYTSTEDKHSHMLLTPHHASCVIISPCDLHNQVYS